MIESESFKKVIEGCGVKLYGSEIVTENEQKIVRVYIIKDGGVTLDECSKVSKIISPLLDLEPPTSGKYSLEVSSPGIERKLNTLDEISLSVGELIKATIIEDGNKLKIRGKLLSVNGEMIEVDDKISKGKKSFNYNQLLKAKTYFQWT